MRNHTCTTSTFIFSCGVKLIFSRVALSMVRERPAPTPTPPPKPLRRRQPHSALHSLHALLIIPPSFSPLMTASRISRHSFMHHRSPFHSCTCLHKLSSLVTEENSHSLSLSPSSHVSLHICFILGWGAKKTTAKSFHPSIHPGEGTLHPGQVASLSQGQHRERQPCQLRWRASL